MVEITYEEQNKVKRMRTEDILRDLWDNIKHTNFQIIGVPENKRKRKGMRKFLKRLYSSKFPQRGKGNSQSSPRGTQSPLEDKTKEKPAKTHTNQTNKG